MQDFYIMMFIVGSIFLSVIILLIILLFRQKNKKRTSVKIIKANNRFKTKNFYGTMKEVFTVDGQTYNYDHLCEIKRGFGFDIFYFDKNPNPIKFNDIDKTAIISSKNLNDIMKNDLIEKLFNSNGEKSLTKILLIALIFLSVAIIIIMLVNKPSLNLANTPENIALIEQAIRNVIR